MRTLEQHRSEVERVLAQLDLEAPRMMSVTDPLVCGRVLAETVTARYAIPSFDNSQMDGFAVRAADLDGASAEHPITLPVGIATAAGDAPVEHVPGTASPVMTGAAIPARADAVVAVEATLAGEFPELTRAGEGNASGSVGFTAESTPGAFIRVAGADVRVGDVVLSSGTRLTPSRVGALTAAGIAEVLVRARPRVLLCSTGNEIAQATTDLSPGSIFDVNTPMLRAMLEGLGADVQVLTSPDEPHLFRAQLQERMSDVQLIITTGGISRGAFEVVKEALDPLGVTFCSVALQPGGPQGYGTLMHGERTVPVLCFPGNPVSALLSCELFLAPTLRSLAGLPRERTEEPRELSHTVVSPADKHQVRRGVITEGGRVRVLAPGSHLVGELARADVLVHIPVGVEELAEGASVTTWRFND